MKIVYFFTSLGMGGAERQGLWLAERMASKGHEVALLVLRGELPQEWPTELPVFRLGMRRNLQSFWAGMGRARNFLREFRPEVLHSHSFHANLCARLLTARLPETAQVSTIHNVFEGGWHRMLAYRLSDGLSGYTIAVSGAVRERFVERKAVSTDKCHVVRNGIDLEIFVANQERRKQVRKVMEVRDNFIWLAVGRVVPAKDFPVLLQALAILRKIRLPVRLWIAGEASEKAEKQLKTQITELGLESIVRWLGLRRDLPALLDAADGFVLSSRWEGMPLVVGEAMAMGKVVVATDVGGVRELVGQEGYLVESRNPDALARGMLRVMRMPPEERAAIGARAQERMKVHFDINARPEQWEEIYRQTAGDRKNPALLCAPPDFYSMKD